ncbi:ABC transporter permease [Atribacter laminatus]|jgi:peptide/nickel transport system permease protein|uniref:Putative D,D-dipeptide transport system permease protein DdpC n=1 Tax=Atribacter laminatus TaxID=2847778 RepID=A0A7T1AKP4_ATRLM|nr:ABC transporter permease [Atribacter laminatus]QPM67684.1 putative D,D-dipeptide transport system permease protein DdpC [Atribacter laminatus]
MILSKKNPKRTKSGKAWYKFSRNPLSVVGLVIVLFVIFSALLAPWVTPYPAHSGKYVNYEEANLSPSAHHLFGTDVFGRDVFTRTIYAFRSSLIMGIVVLMIVVPIGVTLGLLAGYFKETWIDIFIMRITDIFLSVPPLILALAITSVLKPNLTNAMLAVSVMWWPWYTRLVYGMATSLRNEYFVQSAELLGASKFHVLFKEILPNCLSTILTKMTLDMGWVILIGASLSFVGLGEQAPKAALGSMVADGAKYLPEYWWISVFPGLAIMLIVLGFNLLGDGISDLFSMEEA